MHWSTQWSTHDIRHNTLGPPAHAIPTAHIQNCAVLHQVAVKLPSVAMQLQVQAGVNGVLHPRYSTAAVTCWYTSAAARSASGDDLSCLSCPKDHSCIDRPPAAYPRGATFSTPPGVPSSLGCPSTASVLISGLPAGVVLRHCAVLCNLETHAYLAPWLARPQRCRMRQASADMLYVHDGDQLKTITDATEVSATELAARFRILVHP